MLKGAEKAAAILSILGDELSQRILSYLPEDTAIAIISASENLKTPTREALLDVVSEFNEYMTVAEAASVEEKGEQPQPVAAKEENSPLDIISKASSEKIAHVIETERPEVAAYVLSHLPVEKIWEILSMLRESRQAVESRLISLKDVPIAKELEDKILNAISGRLS